SATKSASSGTACRRFAADRSALDDDSGHERLRFVETTGRGGRRDTCRAATDTIVPESYNHSCSGSGRKSGRSPDGERRSGPLALEHRFRHDLADATDRIVHPEQPVERRKKPRPAPPFARESHELGRDLLLAAEVMGQRRPVGMLAKLAANLLLER